MMPRCSVLLAGKVLMVAMLAVGAGPVPGAGAQSHGSMQMSPVRTCEDQPKDREHAMQIVVACDAIALDREQPVSVRLQAMKRRLQVSRDSNVWFFRMEDLQFIEAYAELDKDNVAIKLMIAQQRLGTKRYAEAIMIANEVIENDPSNGIARLIRGVARAQKDPSYADISDLQEAVHLLPDRPEPLMQLGFTLEFSYGRFREAAALYARALPLKKTEAIFYGAVYSPSENPAPALSRALLKMGNPTAAINIMTDLLADNPRSMWRGQVLGYRLEAYRQAGDIPNAIADLNEMMKYVQKHEKPDLLLRRAFLKRELRQFDEAMADIALATANGNLKMILQLQVKLRNAGQTSVEINGEFDAATKAGLIDCMSDKECGARLGVPI